MKRLSTKLLAVVVSICLLFSMVPTSLADTVDEEGQAHVEEDRVDHPSEDFSNDDSRENAHNDSWNNDIYSEYENSSVESSDNNVYSEIVDDSYTEGYLSSNDNDAVEDDCTDKDTASEWPDDLEEGTSQDDSDFNYSDESFDAEEEHDNEDDDVFEESYEVDESLDFEENSDDVESEESSDTVEYDYNSDSQTVDETFEVDANLDIKENDDLNVPSDSNKVSDSEEAFDGTDYSDVYETTEQTEVSDTTEDYNIEENSGVNIAGIIDTEKSDDLNRPSDAEEGSDYQESSQDTDESDVNESGEQIEVPDPTDDDGVEENYGIVEDADVEETVETEEYTDVEVEHGEEGTNHNSDQYAMTIAEAETSVGEEEADEKAEQVNMDGTTAEVPTDVLALTTPDAAPVEAVAADIIPTMNEDSAEEAEAEVKATEIASIDSRVNVQTLTEAAFAEEVKGELLDSPSGEEMLFAGSELPTKADIAFIIDSTGSMSDEINNVKNNLNSFTGTLDDAGLDFRIAIIEYKDITVSGEAESTRVLTDDEGNKWFTTAEQVAQILSRIYVDGGGDGPETAVDALGAVMNDLDFRNDASKFAFLLTDADYKNNNNYGFTDMDDAIEKLKEKGVNISVISDSDYEPTYHDLYTQTDGKFCNIYGNFSEELAELAEHIKTVTRPVTVDVKTEENFRVEREVTYTIRTTIKATDDKQTAHDVTVNLNLPEGVSAVEEITQSIGDLAPGESREVVWHITVPVNAKDTNYTWLVKALSDDFATGVVCMAQDTIQVVGYGTVDYSWVFGKDNYNFGNSDAYDFGYGQYYISDEDLENFLKQIDKKNKSEVNRLADWYADNGSWKDLKNNSLVEWGGSCYGMSLSAALFKVKLLDTTRYNKAEFTHDIKPVTASTNSKLESMINIYHISQATDIAVNSSVLEANDTPEFVSVISTMWEKATHIGDEDSKEQPFIVRLRGYWADDDEWYGHAVVCYGAEECDYRDADNNRYNRRLLIADPNSGAEAEHGTYIYIRDDNSSAFYDDEENYTKFGYRNASLSTLNTYDYFDAMKNHNFEVSANANTDLVFTTETSKAVIIAGKLILVEDMEVSEYNSEDFVSNGKNRSGKTLYTFDTSDRVTVTPREEGGSLNTLITYGGYSARLTSGAESMTLSKDGDIRINGASGDFELNLSVNDSPFGFITITGNADGNVVVSLKDDKLDVSGDITDYSVANEELYSNASDADGAGEQATRFIIEDGKIIALIDKDGDGEFETRYEKKPDGDAPVVVITDDDTVEDEDTHHSTSSGKVVKADAFMRSWKLGSIVDLDFKEIKISEDLKVYVDNNLLVIDRDYMIVNGVLLLKQEYLNTLTIGTHTLTTSNGYSEVFRVV